MNNFVKKTEKTMKSRLPIYLFPALIISFFACNGSHTSDMHDENEVDHNSAGHIHFPAEKAEAFGIIVETVKPDDFNDVIKTSGTIETSASDIYSVTSKKSGVIALSPGLETGMGVSAGELLGSVSSAGIQGGDTNKAAGANLSAAKAEYERLKPLYEEGLVTSAVFREAERAFREAEALAGGGKTPAESLSSPVDGIIHQLYVKTGDYVEAGSPIAVVSKNSTLTLKADLPARYASHLPEIKTANILTEAGKTLKLDEMNGRLISATTTPSASNGYLPIYFSFTGNGLDCTAGYAEVYLICGTRPEVISVPMEAIVEIQGNKYAYMEEEPGEYEKRLVKTGASDGERIEIIAGLESGDKVVSKGSSVIRMAEISAVAPPSHSHNR